MIDRFNEKLEVGDSVAMVISTRSSYSIYKSKIVEFTPKMVRVELTGGSRYLRHPHQLVKLK